MNRFDGASKLLLVTVALFASLLVDRVRGLTIGVVVFPETGHLNPLLAIVEEAAKSGHRGIIFGPEFFMPSCEREIQSMRSFASCHNLGFYNVSMYDEAYMAAMTEMPYFESLIQVTEHATDYNKFLVDKMMQHVGDRPKELDLLLVDFGALQGTAVADFLSIPAVMVWPLTLSFPLESNPSLPALGTGLSTTMTLGQRFINFAVQRLFIAASILKTQPSYNRIRQEVAHVGPVDAYDVYYRRFVITPNIYGLDIAMPLCPNIVPVGFLARTAARSELASDIVPVEWATWLDSCSDSGITYINMGSVAVLPLRWMRHVEAAASTLVAQHGKCVVWKLSKPQQAHLDAKTVAAGPKMRITSFIPFSPRYLLQHKSCRVFVTHCGDTSVYESVQSGVPMVGIPLFADQADMCARVQDSGIGVALNKMTFSADDIVAGSLMMDRNVSASAKIQKLAAMGHVLGGAKRAVEIIHLAAKLGNDTSLFFCKHVDLPWYQRYEMDIMGTLSAVLFFFIWLTTRCFAACCRPSRKVKRD